MPLNNIENVNVLRDHQFGIKNANDGGAIEQENRNENANEGENEQNEQGRKRCRSTKIRFSPEIHTTMPWPSKLFGNHFDCLLCNGEETKQVICKTCRAIYSKDCTKNLRLHIQNIHQQMLADHDEFDEALKIFVVSTFQSFRLVEDENFHAFLETFAELMQRRREQGQTTSAKDVLPSKKTMAANIDTAVQEGQEKLREIAGTITAITMDFASKNVDYLVVTGHRINNEWKMQSIVLAFVPFFGQKTSELVKREVNEQLTELAIPDQQQEQLFVTTDEGSNVIGQGGDHHINCICHFGALLAKRSTKPYRNNQIDEDTKNRAENIGRSLADLEQFVRELKRNNEIREECNEFLHPPTATRWLSHYSMVKAIFDGQNELRQSIQQHEPEQEINLEMIVDSPALQAYVEVLQPVHKMVTIMQTEKFSTASKVLPNLAHLWLHFGAKQQDNQWTSTLKKCARDCFVRKVANLDERCHWDGPIFGKFNAKWIICSAYLNPITFGQIEAIAEKVPRLQILRMLVPHLISRELAGFGENAPPPQMDVANQEPFEVRLQHRTGAVEMTDYERTPIEMTRQNPLEFWQQNENRFPLLARLARKFLSAPASSAPSERAFKELKCIMGDFTRNRLQPNRTAALIFMRSQYLNKL